MLGYRYEVSILVVCMENVCRSPMIEGVLKKEVRNLGLAKKVRVASAGTLASQPGSKPDVRAIRVARLRNINIENIKARKLTAHDIQSYDHILAVDKSVLRAIQNLASGEAVKKIELLLKEEEVPDPYYGNEAGFESVMDTVELAVKEWVEKQLKQ